MQPIRRIMWHKRRLAFEIVPGALYLIVQSNTCPGKTFETVKRLASAQRGKTTYIAFG